MQKYFSRSPNTLGAAEVLPRKADTRLPAVLCRVRQPVCLGHRQAVAVSLLPVITVILQEPAEVSHFATRSGLSSAVKNVPEELKSWQALCMSLCKHQLLI